MIINWQVARTKNITPLIVDIVMLVVALLNLLFLSFDYTYFGLRDYYIRYTPGIVRTYDQIKGIEPHRFTTAYLAQAEGVFRRYAAFTVPERQERSRALTALSLQMIEEDPFQRANKSGDLELIKERVRHFTGTASSSKQAFTTFWQLTPANVTSRAQFFQTDIAPVIQTNYWRRYDRSGRFEDHFFTIDLMFVAIFLAEFAVMWIRAIRRHGSDERVLFPLVRWYDLLGCIPVQGFRALRLIRVWVIYRRLVASGLLTIDDGPIPRMIRRYKAIISEELSDQVALRILSDVQDKVRLGGGLTVIEQTLLPHKGDIQRATVAALRKLEIRLVTERRDEWVRFLTDIAETTVHQAPEYAKAIRTPILGGQVVRLFGRASLEAMIGSGLDRFADALNGTLHTEDGIAFVKAMVSDLLEEVVELSREPLVQALLTSIAVQLIDELKQDSRKVKRWRSGMTQPLPEPPT
ncbi:MAG: hypothetical protein H7338_17980 [Candidatus Sericytochromatia bacterium]|nr:hypothetical protein [Candidatus Sericytochromatia bacterium]